ncbi:hypothetical protein L1887_43477 [Cichorium endivia]|nr:hypothetical protein L1887_43477 [Cichorium endivia]
MNKRKAATGQGLASFHQRTWLDASKGKPSKDDAEGVKKKPKKGGAISFEEFMSVMQPKAKRKAWQERRRDARADHGRHLLRRRGPSRRRPPRRPRSRRKPRQRAAAAAAATGSNSAQADADDASEPEPDAAVNDVGLTDEETTRPSPLRSDSESDSEDEADAVNDEELERKQAAQRRKAEQAAERDQKIVDQIMESGRLFVRNLPFTATDDDIESFFESFGTVKQESDSKIFLYLTKRAAVVVIVAAVVALGHPYLHSMIGKPQLADRRLPWPIHGAGPSASTCSRLVNKDAPADTDKKAGDAQADARRPEEAGCDQGLQLVHALHVGRRCGLVDRRPARSEQVPTSSTRALTAGRTMRPCASRLAETRIIQETREFFSQEGINVDAFGTGRKAGRSDTTMLVKNIPYGTSVDECAESCSRSTARVDKVHHPAERHDCACRDARGVGGQGGLPRACVQALQGRHPVPREGARGRVDVQDGRRQGGQAGADQGQDHRHVGESLGNLAAGGADDEAPRVRRLYIKNLSFSTTDDRLAGAFHGLSDYAFARVQTKPDPKRPGARLSMGYGFVGFKSVAAARPQRRRLWTVKWASSSRFDCPRSFDNTTRGFGFVEYTTVREAQAAFEALKHTHLLGRHLVLQWSKQGENAQDQVDMQREKTKSAFVATGDATANAKHAKIKLNHAQITSAARSARAANNQDDDDDN